MTKQRERAQVKHRLAADAAATKPDRPPETQPPDTQPPDTQPPDTQPPDKQPPDTQPPDKQPPDTQAPGLQTSGSLTNGAPGSEAKRATVSTRHGASSSARSRWAAIDIGSDTVHLLVARLQTRKDGSLEVRHLENRSKLLELGRQVDRRGVIGPHAAEIRAVVERYVRLARRADARIVIGATEASRRARDGEVVLASLTSEIGLPIRVLSGRREAELGFLAARPWLASEGPQLLIDSGGASTEVSATSGAELVGSVSLPLGAAVLADRLPGDPPSALEWALEAVRFGGLLNDLPSIRPAVAWATGGSAHNLVGLEAVRGSALETRLTMGELDRLADQLLRTSARKLARRSGEDPRRVALLAPGALIIAAILRHYDLETCTVIPAGVRDGMVLAAATSGDEWWLDQFTLGRAGDATSGSTPTTAAVPGDAPQTDGRPGGIGA